MKKYIIFSLQLYTIMIYFNCYYYMGLSKYKETHSKEDKGGY